LAFTAAVPGIAVAADASSLSALKAAGLDPFDVYLRMAASLADGGECAWWFIGPLSRDVDDIGAVATVQEETIRVHRAEAKSRDEVGYVWKQAGVFRDVVTGEVPDGLFDPIKGAKGPQASTLKGGPSKVIAQRTKDGLSVTTEVPGSTVGPILIGATVDGDRVGLVHIEDKSRPGRDGQVSTNRTVYRIYASLTELKGSAPSVAASGFYGVRNLGTGRVLVNGMMVKAAMDQPLNPIAWQRIKAAHPDFFAGDRLAPQWGG
jgi:hypothetical protein